MWPTVRHGDVLLVDRDARVSVGDIIAFRVGGLVKLVAHRVVAIEGSRLRCANAVGQLDPWIEEDALVGRVVGIEREGRLHDVQREPANVRMLWALRSGYGVARRAALLLRRSIS